MQHEDGLKACLRAAFEGRDEAGGPKNKRPPVFVKLAPDLNMGDLHRSMDIALQAGVAGFILTNTTIARPETLRAPHRAEAGGLSGQPLNDMAQQMMAEATAHLRRTGTSAGLIGVGGIGSAEQAYARLLAGADLLQLYTVLAMGGPYMVVTRILTGLSRMMAADGVSVVAEVKEAGLSAEQAVRHAAHIAKRSATFQSDN